MSRMMMPMVNKEINPLFLVCIELNKKDNTCMSTVEVVMINRRSYLKIVDNFYAAVDIHNY